MEGDRFVLIDLQAAYTTGDNYQRGPVALWRRTPLAWAPSKPWVYNGWHRNYEDPEIFYLQATIDDRKANGWLDPYRVAFRQGRVLKRASGRLQLDSTKPIVSLGTVEFAREFDFFLAWAKLLLDPIPLLTQAML